MAIKPISKIQISNQVFVQIKENIINGEWSSGTRLPSENELSRMLGVSRISVRSAIQKLASLEILETRQGEGTYVKELSSDLLMNSLIPMLVLNKTDILEILEFRRIIEVESVKLAALRADEKDISELKKIMGEMVRYQNNPKRFAMEDMMFHLAVARASKNSLVLKVNMITRDALLLHMDRIVKELGTSCGLKYHPIIIQAIESRNADKAGKIMKEHIDLTISLFQLEKEAGASS